MAFAASGDELAVAISVFALTHGGHFDGPMGRSYVVAPPAGSRDDADAAGGAQGAAAVAAAASGGAGAAPTAPEVEVEEDAATHTAVLALLAHAGVPFTTLTHAPTRTSEESAAVRGATLASGAKAMLLKAKKGFSGGRAGAGGYALAVLSAERRAELCVTWQCG